MFSEMCGEGKCVMLLNEKFNLLIILILISALVVRGALVGLQIKAQYTNEVHQCSYKDIE